MQYLAEMGQIAATLPTMGSEPAPGTQSGLGHGRAEDTLMFRSDSASILQQSAHQTHSPPMGDWALLYASLNICQDVCRMADTTRLQVSGNSTMDE